MEEGGQVVEESLLLFANVSAGVVDSEPLAAVDFGDLDAAFGARRPFDLAGVADQLRRVAISLKGPCGGDLAALLPDRAEIEELAAGLEAGLFLELAAGGVERMFVVVIFALGNRPCALVFLRPERAAGMDKEDFDCFVEGPEHQETCALFRHWRWLSFEGYLRRGCWADLPLH